LKFRAAGSKPAPHKFDCMPMFVPLPPTNAWGKPDEAAKWKKELESNKGAVKIPD
jgi:hypothetical protein